MSFCVMMLIIQLVTLTKPWVPIFLGMWDLGALGLSSTLLQIWVVEISQYNFPASELLSIMSRRMQVQVKVAAHEI